jgi:hypothetical protein
MGWPVVFDVLLQPSLMPKDLDNGALKHSYQHLWEDFDSSSSFQSGNMQENISSRLHDQPDRGFKAEY